MVGYLTMNKRPTANPKKSKGWLRDGHSLRPSSINPKIVTRLLFLELIASQWSIEYYICWHSQTNFVANT